MPPIPLSFDVPYRGTADAIPSAKLSAAPAILQKVFDK
jgi:hypothetical protein